MSATTAAAVLGDALDRSGLTKSEVSRRSGVSRALLDAYLKGTSQPSLAQVQRIGAAAGLRLDVAWVSAPAPDAVKPAWASPSPTMVAGPTTIDERAALLARVVPATMALRRRARGELEFPPFRTLRRSA